MGVVLAAVVALLVPLSVVSTAQGAPGGGGKPDAGGSEPIATQIRIDSVRDADALLPTTPGTEGLAYVVAGEDFTVAVSFLDAQGVPAPLSWNKDVGLTLLVEDVPLATIPVGAGESSARFEAQSLLDPGTDLRMVVLADTKPRALTDSRDFDVLIDDEPVSGTSRTSIGGSGGTDGCNPVAPDPLSPGQSVCADLLPPSGGFSGAGTLSHGLCGNECEGSYIQALVAFPPSPTNPSTLVMKCDKDECGVGPIRRQVLEVNLSPEGDGELNVDVRAEACPAKGVVGEGQSFCVDYVQSTRDNAGDTFLYLLFTIDAKVRFL